MNNQEFIKEIGVAAQKDWAIHKILPSLTIAQAILESSWGKSGLTTKGKNLFGMKCGSNWRGLTCTMRTMEQTPGGKEYYVNAKFRAYDTWDDCIYDHGEFLKTSRYEKVRGETDYKKACQYIKDAGYATDIKYVSKLVSLINKFKLHEYDTVAIEMPKPRDPETPPCHFYTVKKGDNLSKIAKTYKTTISKLVVLNSITDPDKIRIGQMLKIG